MREYSAPDGFVGLGLAIIVGVIALGAAADAYFVHHHHVADFPSYTATTSDALDASTTGYAHSHPMKPPQPGSQASSTIITQADSGTVVHMREGDTFKLNLGNELTWSNIKVVDSSIVSGNAENDTFTAKSKGTTTLTATGAPICAAHLLCAQYLVEFELTIVVD